VVVTLTLYPCSPSITPVRGAAMTTSTPSSGRRKYGKNSSMSSNLCAVRITALSFDTGYLPLLALER
jgi:hypothetical protein